MTSRDLAALLRNARIAAGDEPSEARKRAGISDETLRRWERGECLSQVLALSKLLDAYGLELSVKRAKTLRAVNP